MNLEIILGSVIGLLVVVVVLSLLKVRKLKKEKENVPRRTRPTYKR